MDQEITKVMKRPVDIVLELKKSKVEEQPSIIESAWFSDNDDFFSGLEISTNPKLIFGLTSVPEIVEDDDGTEGSFNFLYFQKMCDNLAHGNLSLDQKKKLVEDCAMTANVTEWNHWYRKILLKNLHTSLPLAVIQKTLLSLTTS